MRRMEKSSKRNGAGLTKSSRSGLSGRRKSEAVIRVMNGEHAHEVAEDLGVSSAQVETWRREFILAGERRMGELPLGLFERCLSPFERLVPLATLISVSIGVLLYVQGQKKAQLQQVTDNFNALDDKYIEYAKLCLQHPDLDVFDIPVEHPTPRTVAQVREESMMFAVLTSMLERAFMTYHDQSDGFNRQEWESWSAYTRTWLTRQNFLAEWNRTKEVYDRDFRVYVDHQIANISNPTTRPAL